MIEPSEGTTCTENLSTCRSMPPKAHYYDTRVMFHTSSAVSETKRVAKVVRESLKLDASVLERAVAKN